MTGGGDQVSVQQRAADRSAARIVGALYLAGMVIGMGGNVLIQSILSSPGHLTTLAASGTLLATGAMCWLATVVGDVAHGVVMFPVLRRSSERMAVGYLAARIVDGVFIAVMALLVVLQIPLGVQYVAAGPSGSASLGGLGTVLAEANVYAYEFGMTAVGVAGLLLCSTLLRARLIPRPLALWGLVGYAALLVGSTLQVLGFELHSIQAVPGGLWEVFIGVWLIVKGFSVVSSSPSQDPGEPARGLPDRSTQEFSSVGERPIEITALPGAPGSGEGACVEFGADGRQPVVVP
jgi:hypothetical protein